MTDDSGNGGRMRLRIRVLLVERDADELHRIRQMLEQSGLADFEATAAARLEDAIAMAGEAEFDALIVGLAASEADAALAGMESAAARLPVVAIADSEELGVEALRLGARDYLLRAKCDVDLLERTLRHAVERERTLAELEASRQREHFLATHDSLTGIANRFYFQDLMSHALSKAARDRRPLALLCFDIDRFKRINDTLGTSIGDELLKMVAERFCESTRSSDVVARLDGDEFVVLAPNVRREYDPARVAETLLQTLSRPFLLSEQECWITASAGIAVFPRDGQDTDVLIRNAEAAMYESKTLGPGRYHYYAEHMNEVAGTRLGLEKRLHQAIERDELLLHFQPQVDVARARIVGAEALIRWQHPKRGLVLPGDFIPIAEDTGMIRPIGEFVLRSACEHAVRWNRGRAKPLRIGVNVAAQQLNQKGFADVVTRILQETGLPPDQLEIEITESSILEPGGITMAALVLLRRLGVHVSIDDFGTGYSSLTALMNLPVSGFKIDRSFIRAVMSKRANAAITTGLIEIGKGLGLATIAEGIETREQLHYLLANGCTHMQGYLLGRPVPAEEFEAQLNSKRPPWVVALEGLRA